MDCLDTLLHQPLRTQIAAFLAGANEATFSELKHRLDVSDGNLESHLKKLIAANYVAVRKEFASARGTGRPQSCYTLTPIGHAALRDYVAALQRLLVFDGASAGEENAPAPPSFLPAR